MIQRAESYDRTSITVRSMAPSIGSFMGAIVLVWDGGPVMLHSKNPTRGRGDALSLDDTEPVASLVCRGQK